MARIVVGSYMVRYPLGGMMSWTLQWLLGLKRLGHDVYFVEKSTYPNSCYDPIRGANSDDFSYGLAATESLLERYRIADRVCYVDYSGEYHGITRDTIEEIFRESGLFLDLGTHGAWLAEARKARTKTAIVDGEPGYTQMKMENQVATTKDRLEYDFYFSNGAKIGTSRTTAPSCGKRWRPVFNPVVLDLFTVEPPPLDAPYTTVMNWQSHASFEYRGNVYGQKDVEFSKFMSLPGKVAAPIEVAVSGQNVPIAELSSAGWRIQDAQRVTRSLDEYYGYIRRSRGEFSVCKNVFVATHTGWFSDRSAAYLASGRPVVLQETGFSDHLPTGEGLFAVRTPVEAADAIDQIENDYERHSERARQIASEWLAADRVLPRFLEQIGIAS